MYHLFTSAHLEFPYKWDKVIKHINPGIVSAQDRKILNKNQGYEMIYFIQSLAKSWGWNDPDTFMVRAKQLEGIIIDEIPENIVSYAEIKQWIESRYNVD